MSLFEQCDLKAVCINQGKRSNEMFLTYSVQGSENNHTELVKEFYANSLIDSFDTWR
jgi:hypothetical protein